MNAVIKDRMTFPECNDLYIYGFFQNKVSTYNKISIT